MSGGLEGVGVGYGRVWRCTEGTEEDESQGGVGEGDCRTEKDRNVKGKHLDVEFNTV